MLEGLFFFFNGHAKQNEVMVVCPKVNKKHM